MKSTTLRRALTSSARVRGALRGWREGADGVGAVANAPSGDPAPPTRTGSWDPTSTSALYTWCRQNGIDTRPQYLWPVLHVTHAARALELERMCALEFGVAGGNGLLALEDAVAASRRLGGVEADIFGFDTGKGMPRPTDPRDAPWLVEESYFAMDEAALRARLRAAHLVLGPVADTVGPWREQAHAPIGFISFDLDYYTSTVDAFGVLEGAAETLLPRVLCYFDDLFGYGWTDFVGEREAIDEFNRTHETRKIAKIHGLRFELPRDDFFESWHEKLYVVHVFDHPRYAEHEGRIDERWLTAHRLSPGQ